MFPQEHSAMRPLPTPCSGNYRVRWRAALSGYWTVLLCLDEFWPRSGGRADESVRYDIFTLSQECSCKNIPVRNRVRRSRFGYITALASHLLDEFWHITYIHCGIWYLFPTFCDLLINDVQAPRWQFCELNPFMIMTKIIHSLPTSLHLNDYLCVIYPWNRRV